MLRGLQILPHRHSGTSMIWLCFISDEFIPLQLFGDVDFPSIVGIC